MAEKIAIEKTSCGVLAWGSKIKLVNGENIVDVDAWEAYKKLPHIAARIEAGELIEGERHSSKSVSPSGSSIFDNEESPPEESDEDEKPKSKRKRKKSS